ncbi:unnamed protein product [Lactuca virosa]|uniref:DC1 domain-containing protein n=1 Tax=Lactuca virosa TaxID=75947 RepID=A0AAU9M906_9ASTR|nr:unnamed protein product [Lactuca virosa]
MEQLVHFSHMHPLILVYLQSNHNNETSDEEDEDEGAHENDFVVKDNHVGQCNMCKEHIYSFHLCYYYCKDCDYSLHKFCAELPNILRKHPLHPNHNLTLSKSFQDSNPVYDFDHELTCCICNLKWKYFCNYHCSVCKFNMDITCATISQHNGPPKPP